DKDRTERALPEREADHRILAAGAEGFRAHAEHRRRRGIEAAARIEARAIRGFGHRAAAAELAAQPLAPSRRGIGFRRDAGRGFEDAVEMKAAHAGDLGEDLEARLALRRLDHAAGLGDHRRLLGARRGRVGTAALARAEAGALRRLAALIKSNVFAIGPARAARRPAINAGGAHGIEESAVR